MTSPRQLLSPATHIKDNPAGPTTGPGKSTLTDVSAADSSAHSVITGSGKPTTGITAARPMIKKAIFYIGNVDSTTTDDNLQRFLMSKNINVISLRRITNTATPQTADPIATASSQHTSFRLAVQDKDSPTVLDPTLWPEGLRIRR